jgi:hypothetical protein
MGNWEEENMRRQRWFAPLLGALLTLCLHAYANPQDPLSDDPQLDRKVEVSAEGIPVSDLLARLTARTGVSLRAARDVADDKVIVCGAARPLRDLMADLAALYNDVWMRVEEPKGIRYLLTRTERAKEYEDGLERDVTGRLEAQLDEQVRALNETPEQLARRPKNDPIVKNLSSELLHGRKATQLYSQLNRAQRDALFRDHYLNISLASSSPGQQQMAREAFDEVVATLKDLDARQRQEHPEVHIDIDSPDSLAKYGIRFNLHNENNGGLSAMVVQIVLGRSAYMTMGSFDCNDQWLLPAHGNPYTLRKVPAGAPLPAQEETLKAAAGKQLWSERLKSLSTAADAPVLADFYRSPAIVKPLETETTAAAEDPTSALDTLCRPAGYLWWVRGKTLLLRKRDWFHQRRYEVTDEWLHETIKLLAGRQGRPTYGDVARLLELTTAQIGGLNNLLAGDGSAYHDEDNLAGLRELLTLVQMSQPSNTPVYCGEPPSEQEAGSGVRGADLSDQGRDLLSAFCRTVRQPTGPVDLAAFHARLYCYTPDMLKAVPGNQEKDIQVHIVWETSSKDRLSGELDRHITLRLPLHIPDDRTDPTHVELAP